MPAFIIRVPFHQHDEYKADADLAEEGIEIARHDPRTFMDTDIKP